MIDTHMSPLPGARILMDTFHQRMTDGAARRLQEGTGAKYPGCWTIHCLCWYCSVAMRSTCHITVGLQRRSARHRQILSMEETLSIIRIKDDVITIILVTVKCGRRFWVPLHLKSNDAGTPVTWSSKKWMNTCAQLCLRSQWKWNIHSLHK